MDNDDCGRRNDGDDEDDIYYEDDVAVIKLYDNEKMKSFYLFL